jgi:Rrf2 family protein
MQITRQADYAARAVLYLSNIGAGRSLATSQVAREQKIPPAFLSKILARLTQAGITQAARGRYGGVKLARAPQDITLLEVIEAIDGPIRLIDCAGSSSACPFSDSCPMRPVWCGAQQEIIATLQNKTFADFVTRAG